MPASAVRLRASQLIGSPSGPFACAGVSDGAFAPRDGACQPAP